MSSITCKNCGKSTCNMYHTNYSDTIVCCMHTGYTPKNIKEIKMDEDTVLSVERSNAIGYIKTRSIAMIEEELEYQKTSDTFKYLSANFKDGYMEGLKRALLLIDNVE